VFVHVPDYPKESFTATVSYISLVVDEKSRTVQVRCLLPNPHWRLLPAMYAAIDVQSDLNDKEIIVPLTAIFTNGGF
jgi:cobalt-zinc-cadmium efflux system membrane fusion protein